jgi:DNA-binding PadR family transcriptional regulator
MVAREWNYNTLKVLHAVASGVRYGFDIMDATGLQSGQVYRGLSQLQEAGLVASEWEDPDAAIEEKRPRRRYYDVTPEGRNTLRNVAERYSAFGRIPAARDAETRAR